MRVSWTTTSTYRETHREQVDLKRVGWVFAFAFLPAANVLSYGILLAFAAGGLSLHDLFQQQAMQMLDRSDLSEEQKQEALVAMACPCCGVGAMAYTVKLKR